MTRHEPIKGRGTRWLVAYAVFGMRTIMLRVVSDHADYVSALVEAQRLNGLQPRWGELKTRGASE